MSAEHTKHELSALGARRAEMRIGLHVGKEPVMDESLQASGFDYEFDPLRVRYIVHVTPETFQSGREHLGKLFALTAKAWHEQD